MSLTASSDDFERRVAAGLRAIADEVVPIGDVEPTVDAMLAARARHRSNRLIAVGGGVLAAAAAAGIALASFLGPRPDVGPSPTPNLPSATASASPSQEPPASAAAVLPGGTYAAPRRPGLSVYNEPGGTDAVAVLSGANVYVRGNARAADGSTWQEIQFADPDFNAWVFGWVPLVIDGERTLVRRPAPECPTQDEFSAGFVVFEPPSTGTCFDLGAWSTSGYLVRVAQPDEVPYAGDPAWLIRPAHYALVGAVGPAITTWELPLWFDPAWTGSIDDAWISERGGPPRTRVTVQGGAHHQASRDCHLVSATPRLGDPMDRESIDWCEQRFVVTTLIPGFAEPPSERPAMAVTLCTNPQDGYSVQVPVGWAANEAGSLPPCVRFERGVEPPSVDGPVEASIRLTVFDGVYGWHDPPDWLAFEGRKAGAFDASRGELGDPQGIRSYQWIVMLGGVDSENGPTLLATTAGSSPTYDENKRVLDWIMASLRPYEP
jgi:hypothetical protein